MTHQKESTHRFHTAPEHMPPGHDAGTHDSHAQSALPVEILELLQRHAEELLRTSREHHRRSTATTDAPIVDPWALVGTGSAITADGHRGRLADPLQKLLAIGEKLLAKLESPIKNPFDFVP